MAINNPEMDSTHHGLCHFIKGQYLQNFLNGELSLAHFSTYKKCEVDIFGRQDEHEGIISMSSASKTRMFIGEEKVYGEHVPIEQCNELTGLTGVVKFWASDNNPCHLFCMTAYPTQNGTYEPDEHLFDGNDYLVKICDLPAFLKRFDKAVLDIGLSARRDFVEYFEIDDHPKKATFFSKLMKYSYQREFRFAVFGHESKDRLTLKLGDLRSIVAVYRWDKENKVK